MDGEYIPRRKYKEWEAFTTINNGLKAKLDKTLCSNLFNIFPAISYASKTVVSSRWMMHREKWVLNISIQLQYPVLTDTYKKTEQYITNYQLENLQEIEEGQNAV